jgi:hypothetical protein
MRLSYIMIRTFTETLLTTMSSTVPTLTCRGCSQRNFLHHKALSSHQSSCIGLKRYDSETGRKRDFLLSNKRRQVFLSESQENMAKIRRLFPDQSSSEAQALVSQIVIFDLSFG